MSAATTLSATWEPRVLSILRCMTGLLFLEHGTAKVFGFPHAEMFDHLELASVSGATQIRAGVMRPEILIPRAPSAGATGEEPHATGLEVGSLLRVIRQPHFGRIGNVVELPPELRPLESEAKVRVLVVEFADDHTRAVVPRANVELIAE